MIMRSKAGLGIDDFILLVGVLGNVGCSIHVLMHIFTQRL